MAITCVTPNGGYGGAYTKENIFNFLMGYDLTVEQWGLITERANMLGKVFNLREGFTREDDTIAPKNFEQPLTQGPKGASWIGFTVNKDIWNEQMTKQYNDAGCDDMGIPTNGKLQELGLEYLIPVVTEVRSRS